MRRIQRRQSNEQAKEPAEREFVDLLARHDDRMRALVYSVLGSAQQMDDVLQDAYIKAFRAYAGFRGESSFATWLGSIVYRTCIDYGRASSRRSVAVSGSHEIERLAENGVPQDQIDAHLTVKQGMMQLSPDHRAILALVDLESMTMAEAAAVLDVPQGTAASRLSRARRALHEVLAAEFVPAGEERS